MDLGVTVLASLRGGHLNDLAGAVLDHDVAVLAERRALHGKSGRSTGIGAIEGDFMLEDGLEVSILCLFQSSRLDVKVKVKATEAGDVSRECGENVRSAKDKKIYILPLRRRPC